MVAQVLNDDVLNELGEEFTRRVREGSAVSIDEMAARFSEEHRESVREFLEAIALLENLKHDSQVASPGVGELPREFGRYRIERSLGEGGMGAVYLAHDTQLNRKVALKTPKFARQTEDTMVARFYREARSAATLQHPNICPVHDVGEIDGVHYISMAYIEGRPLSDYISARKFTPVASVLRIVRKVALAIHEAHRRGLIHRDLKPANIMISRHNEPIVMDFGLARQFESTDEADSLTGVHEFALSECRTIESRLTMDGTVMGSPGYMAPEQLRGEQQWMGPSCDIYALGVVLYELLTFQLPFPGDGTVMSVVQSVLADEPPDASAIRQDLSPPVVEICRKAMAKIPSERFRTMEDVAAAISIALKSERKESSPHEMSEVRTPSTSPQLARSREQYELARSLYREGQIAAAVSILEKMVANDGDGTSPFRKWAEAELPKARSRIAQNSDDPREIAAPPSLIPKANVITVDTENFTTVRTPRQGDRRASRRTQKHRALAVSISLLVLLLAGLGMRQLLRGKGDSSIQQSEGSGTVAAQSASSPDADHDATPASNHEETIEDESPDATKSDVELAQTDEDTNRTRDMATPAQRLWRLDQNRDGKISRQELATPRGPQSLLSRRIRESFDAFDLPPRDGLLDRFEMQRVIRLMRPREGGKSGARRP